ncbi:MAG: PIN/TRAM domain-containing protein [Planctomycetia bacterium 21-64-5]|nr:MAG: PIN/TRAM domain-containing protein [Planctomycetia bacterium 21-64-5]HQU43996.1 PIN domain-containing protein [Pirellulales bacterium]
MPLFVLRFIFFLVAAGGAVSLLQAKEMPKEPMWLPWAIFGGIMLLAATIVAFDVLVPRKRLDIISSVYIGLIVGLFLTYVGGLALSPVAPLGEFTRTCINLGMALVLCYTCISMLMQTRNDFRFIIPYVEFSKEVKGLKPYILDTSVVIDGRIADVVETKVLDSQLIMPRFVLGELQAIADSSDRLRRSRGRRGLDILNRLRSNPTVDLLIFDRTLAEFEGQPVDLKLVLLAKHLDGKVVTNDYNLNKVAKLHGVDVINLNDLANALKPLFLPGESLEVHLVKPGEEPGQGIGYLDDGTMIVVEGGREHLNKAVKVAVTSVLQTSAGRMIFGRCDSVVRRNEKAT